MWGEHWPGQNICFNFKSAFRARLYAEPIEVGGLRGEAGRGGVGWGYVWLTGRGWLGARPAQGSRLMKAGTIGSGRLWAER